MVTLFNIMVMGNWQVWMQVKLYFFLSEKSPLFSTCELDLILIHGKISELQGFDWNFLDLCLLCQLLSYYNFAASELSKFPFSLKPA